MPSAKPSTPGPGAIWDKTKYYFDLGYTQPLGEALLTLKIYKNIEEHEEKNYSASSINPNYEDGQLVLDRTVESDRSYGGNVTIAKPFGDHEMLLGMDYKVLAFGMTDSRTTPSTATQHRIWKMTT